MSRTTIWVVLSAFFLTAPVQAKNEFVGNPGCETQTPQQCVNLAMEAIGGRERLQQITSLRVQTVGYTLLMEQSYRQEPFITSYDRSSTTLDFAHQRMLSEVKLTWPEADANQAESEIILVTGRDGGVRRGKSADTPCSLAELDATRQALALGPVPLLLTAAGAPDLHFEGAARLRDTLHTVVGFTRDRVPVRILLNRFNHLPDAIETKQEFHDFWYFWGDVYQRIYFDNWKLFQGIAYPTNVVEERNAREWRSSQALNVEFNIPIEEEAFHMDATIAKQSAASKGWNRPFQPNHVTALASGIDLFLGAWNTTLVRQSDGIVILEAPISETYVRGVVEEAGKRYPGAAIKAVLSTSDSWPHIGGVRYAWSQRFPVYILDLNRNLLNRLIIAPHSLDSDSLEKTKHLRREDFRIVSEREQVGAGPNRMELYPLRGPSTERQYMVYFPEHHLLYASDTLVLNDDNTLYDPELMNEVAQAVQRANLKVDTVFAMHQGPVPWNQVVAQLQKAR